ncbi:MAG: hypothetical protein EBZ50_03845 [Alphaproteobacteria bacterium]|nr:hypothetical protein [Alphaproteobacteria bacterium]
MKNPERDAKIVRLFLEGVLTYAEIGARFGLSNERMRQILRDAGYRRRDYGTAVNSHASARAAAQKRADAVRGTMSPRCQKAVELVKSGLTFTETAAELGITRSAVAGACNRAGLKVGREPERLKKIAAINSEAAKALWAEVKAHEAKHNPKGKTP